MSTVTCPHCGAATPPGAFCESCGKALPSAVPTTPRVVTGDVLPTSAAGQQMLGEELAKQTKKAAYALLAVGIIQATCGAVLLGTLSQTNNPELQVTPLLYVIQFGCAALFIGLYFWARKAPLPASIVGLVVYCTLIILNVINAVSTLSEDGPRRGFGGLGIGILDIIIIVMLVQGIQAGLKHKKLIESQGAPPPIPA